MSLPRLLEDNRVEVRLELGRTHVMKEKQLDALIAHLQAAKNLLTAQTADRAAGGECCEPALCSCKFCGNEGVVEPFSVCEVCGNDDMEPVDDPDAFTEEN